jgi:hypothetical protein
MQSLEWADYTPVLEKHGSNTGFQKQVSNQQRQARFAWGGLQFTRENQTLRKGEVDERCCGIYEACKL